MPRRLTLALLSALALVLALATSAHALSPVPPFAPDAEARQVTALDGTVVWVSGEPGSSQRLMQRDAAGTIGPVRGAPAAAYYRTVDLGRDRANRLTLTYLRCSTASRCDARQDDLQGRRASVRGLAPTGCSLTTAPALWRTRAAYGLSCRKGNAIDPRRTGLYSRTGSGTPRRLPLPAEAVEHGADAVTSVDLRGTRVAAIVSDVYAYAFTTSTSGAAGSSYLAAASEGDADQSAPGLAIAPGGTFWSLTNAEHAGDPLQTIVFRLRGDCREHQTLDSAPERRDFRAIDLAVDGETLLLAVPGVGVVAHAFTPERAC